MCTDDIYGKVHEWRSRRLPQARTRPIGRSDVSCQRTRRANGGRLTLTIATRLSGNGLACFFPADIILSPGRLWVRATRKQWYSLAITLRLGCPSQHAPITGGVSREGKQETYYRNRRRWG